MVSDLEESEAAAVGRWSSCGAERQAAENTHTHTQGNLHLFLCVIDSFDARERGVTEVRPWC